MSTYTPDLFEDTSLNKSSEYFNTIHALYLQTVEKLRKPNILLLGGSRSQRNEMVALAYGKGLDSMSRSEEEGVLRYESPDIPVVIYEGSDMEHVVTYVVPLLKALNTTGIPHLFIHGVWIIPSRIPPHLQPDDIRFCLEHLHEIPILLLFPTEHSSPMPSSPPELDSIRISNLHKIIDTSSSSPDDLKDAAHSLVKNCTALAFKRARHAHLRSVVKECGLSVLHDFWARLSLNKSFIQDLMNLAESLCSSFKVDDALVIDLVMQDVAQVTRALLSHASIWETYMDSLSGSTFAHAIAVVLTSRLTSALCQIESRAIEAVIAGKADMLTLRVVSEVLSSVLARIDVEEVRTVRPRIQDVEWVEAYITSMFSLLE